MPRLGALALFVCLGAVLLFGLEPLVGRLLLPACGGGFQVWATCLMFFQGALFLGYLYCHLLAPRLGRWHLLILALPLPLIFAWVHRGAAGLDPDPAAPITSLLVWLTLWIALPFALLASTGVVAQSWLARSPGLEHEDPYRLYAASNAGSLAALLGYPVLIEPWMGLANQRLSWGLAYLAYLALAWWVAPRGAAPAAQAPTPAPEPSAEPAPTRGQVAHWVLLAAAPSALLMAVTNVISMDIGSAPFVWVVPLSIYLLSFVLVFGRRRWCPWAFRRFWPEVFLLGLYYFTLEQAVAVGGVVHLGVLFCACLVGHARLHELRPSPRHLTGFYLAISLGGWLGGIFVGLVAPFAFSHLYEYPISLLALALALGWGRWGAARETLAQESRLVHLGSLLVVGVLLFQMGTFALRPKRSVMVERFRDAYGVYRVVDQNLDGKRVRTLYHGTTEHGFQLRDNPEKPVGYYHPQSGLGDLMHLRSDQPWKIGVIGLGCGASAAYTIPGDRLVFYELDPRDEDVATRQFTFLSDARARGVDVRVVPGDARLSLAAGKEVPPGGFDLVLVDAFSSDAIPTHLLTEEAMRLFWERINQTDGWLLYHLSNRYYFLEPVVARAGRAAGLKSAFKIRRPVLFHGHRTMESPTDYGVLRSPDLPLEPLKLLGDWRTSHPDPDATPWTDDYANLLEPLGVVLEARLHDWWQRTTREDDQQ